MDGYKYLDCLNHLLNPCISEQEQSVLHFGCLEVKVWITFKLNPPKVRWCCFDVLTKREYENTEMEWSKENRHQLLDFHSIIASMVLMEIIDSCNHHHRDCTQWENKCLCHAYGIKLESSTNQDPIRHLKTHLFLDFEEKQSNAYTNEFIDNFHSTKTTGCVELMLWFWKHVLLLVLVDWQFVTKVHCYADPNSIQKSG